MNLSGVFIEFLFKSKRLFTLFLLVVFALSCTQQQKRDKQPVSLQLENLEPQVDLVALQSDFRTWWTYYNNHIKLNKNLIAFDEYSNEIEKGDFLIRLQTGDYIPLKVKSNSTIDNYILVKLDENSHESIMRTIKNEALVALNFYNMEGMPFPEFNFTDLHNDQFTNDNTKGKTIILKTWFINCVACIKEFDELNAFVDSQNANDDILFLSLAIDEKEELNTFLSKKPFKYKVIPSQNQFISNVLNLNAYPTHIVIDQEGVILKVLTNATEMIEYIEQNFPAEKNLSVVSPSLK